MPRNWEITKEHDRHGLKVICETDSNGVVTLSCQYPDQPGTTLEVPDSNTALAVIEQWDGSGSMLDAFGISPAPEPEPEPDDDEDEENGEEATPRRRRGASAAR